MKAVARALGNVALAILYLFGVVCLIVLVLVGCAMTWVYKLIGWPNEDAAMNCVNFAIPKWLRIGPTKSYLVIRMVKGLMVPRVYFTESIDGLEVEHFKPWRPRRGWRGFLHSFKFKGRVRKGKGEE